MAELTLLKESERSSSARSENTMCRIRSTVMSVVGSECRLRRRIVEDHHGAKAGEYRAVGWVMWWTARSIRRNTPVVSPTRPGLFHKMGATCVSSHPINVQPTIHPESKGKEGGRTRNRLQGDERRNYLFLMRKSGQQNSEAEKPKANESGVDVGRT